MAITDIADNPLAPATLAQMLGFVEVSAAELLTLDMYRFLHEQIRTADEKDGNLFVRRYIDGAQAVWQITQGKIFDIKKLWSVTEIPDEFLQFLKNIVGWTNEPITKRVTDGMDDFTLRRLISLSIPLWKNRGPEDTITDILQALTGERVRIWNWFDLRWVLDVTAMGEDHQGRDPFVLELPTEGSDEYFMNVRIMDSGSLDRDLVVNVVKLMRPTGERIEVSFLDFLDQFTLDNDDGQWGALTGGTGETPQVPVVQGGLAKLTDDLAAETSFVILSQGLTWSEYVAYWRMRPTTGTSGSILAIFYATDLDNDYSVKIDFTAQTIVLQKQVANTVSPIATFVPTSILTIGEFFGIRVHVAVEGATNRIKVYLDGTEIIDTTDSAHTAGSIGFGHSVGVDVELDEAEVFEVPLASELVDINAA